MSNPKQDPKFNETPRRMMDQKPKPHEDMKKGRKPGANKESKNEKKDR